MSINALNIIPCKTDSCPTMGDYAIKKKMNVSWANRKRGDIVLFDFNHNGTSDHIGIVVALNADGTIDTIEGNTGSGSNTNGGEVQKRTRRRKDVNYFVRPKYDKNVTADMVIETARSQLGVKESPKNSNKVKYNVWFYGKNISAFWCCTFVCWVFAHVEGEIKPVTKPAGKYSGTIPGPTIKLGDKGNNVKLLQKFLNWYHPAWKLKEDGEDGALTETALKVFQKTEGIDPDGIYGKDSNAKAKAYKATKPAPKPTPAAYTGAFPDLVTNSGQRIAYTARDLAYAKGTSESVYTYPKGKAKAAFRVAINKVYPNRKSWSKQCQEGASCDVGAGTIIRYSGVDTKVPRGLKEQLDHFKKSSLWKNTGLKKCSLAGDVAMHPSPSAHIWIGLGDGNLAEANHTWKYFEHITKDSRKINGKPKAGVYRCTKASPIVKGDRGSEVIKWQKFLNWAGFNCGAADGDFGEKGVAATKAFQKKVGLDQDGIVGSGTISKAKVYKK